jgi:hypothetical protein
MAEFFQFAPQFLMVVDFAVEHNGYIAIFGQNRLVAAEPRSIILSRVAPIEQRLD